MEVRQLNTLIRAAQFQSFSKAAESLGYSQSAVTVHRSKRWKKSWVCACSTAWASG